MARYKQYEGYQMTRLKKLSANNDSVVAFMPIKPIYAEKLIKGEKKYEFRKKLLHDVRGFGGRNN